MKETADKSPGLGTLTGVWPLFALFIKGNCPFDGFSLFENASHKTALSM